jgi:hypothetical protein
MTRDYEQLYEAPDLNGKHCRNYSINGSFGLVSAGCLVLYDDLSGNKLPLVDLCK